MVPKHDLLKLPDDLDGNLRALLHTPPPPYGIPGSRKVAPKPPVKPRQRRQPKPPKVAGRYAYESAPVLKEGAKPKKRKAAKKR